MNDPAKVSAAEVTTTPEPEKPAEPKPADVTDFLGVDEDMPF